MERTQHALLTLGVSVLAGSNTTNLAGVWLWLGTMVFFNKFAFLINMTICSAMLWSLLFLPSALMVVGPYGSLGSWRAGWQWMISRLPGRRSLQISPDDGSDGGKVQAPEA